MFKNMLKRAWLSITRKPSKTVILIVVMFVMANLVLASISIKKAVNESTDFAKQSLGSTIYLTVDMEKLREESQRNIEDGGEPVRIRIERPDIKLDMVKSIADSSYIKDYTYGINGTAKEEGISTLDNGMSNGTAFSIGGNRSMNLYGNIAITGINSYAFINEVQNKKMELIEGSYFDENTNDKIIISNELASLNDLKIGDKITLLNEEIDIENYDPRSEEEPTILNSKSYELEIIGIYDVDTDNFNGNNIYMNVDTAAKFLKEDKYNDGNYSVDNISYFLKNPDDADSFIKEANKKYPTLKEDNLKLDINSEDYDKMVGPIKQVGSFSNTVLWIVIISSILIITLIINNNIKDRKYEIGVLMSLGLTKKNIIGQILTELIIVGTIGFILSIGTSYFLANTMGNILLEKQLELSEEQNENNFGRPGTNSNFIVGGRQKGNQNISNVEIIDNIDISVGIINYAILFLAIYLISAVAMIIPSINIVKYDPKTILTGRQ